MRYVYLQDGTLVNAEIIKQGYGFAYTYFPFTKRVEFRDYESQARQATLGLWADCQIELDKNGSPQTNPVSYMIYLVSAV